MELLGNSQTFLGTLATLTILCIFFCKSNFIYSILEEIKMKFEEEIKSLRTNTKIERITEKTDYKLLRQVANNDNSDNPELKAEAIALLAKITDAKLQLQFKYIPVEGTGDTLIEDIHSSKEQILAPLYTFCYCLVIFIFDELLRIPTIGNIDFLCSVLSIFSTISIVFWGLIWIKFLIVYFPWNSSKIHNFTKETEQRGESLLYSVIKKSLLCGLFFIIGIWIIRYFILPHRYLYGIVVSFIIPIVYIGYKKLFVNKNAKEYTYLLTIGHFFGFILLSVLFCLILFTYIGIFDSYNHWLNPFQIDIFKIIILCAILLNGLILPFFMPYLCYYIIYIKAQRDVKDSKTKAEAIENDLIKSLEEFSQKVT